MNGASAAHRVAVVSHDALRTGAPISLLNIWGALREHHEWRASFLCLEGGPLVDQFRGLGPTTTLRQARSTNVVLRRLISDDTRLRLDRAAVDRWLRKIGTPALLYANTITIGHCGDVARRRGIPVITHVHELEQWIVQQVRPDLVALSVSSSDLLIAASEAVRRNLIRNHGAQPERVHTVLETALPQAPSSPDVRNKVRTRLCLSADDRLVLGVGTLDWRKGADLFVQVAVRAASQDPRIHFGWIGSASEEAALRWRHDANNSSYGDRIHYLGEQSAPADYYAAADLFCLTSREDPYPLVMIEAASAGLPLVGFHDTGGVKEFTNAGGGVLVGYLDIVAMADACVQLINNPARLHQLAGEAVANSRNHLPSVAADQISALMRRALS